MDIPGHRSAQLPTQAGTDVEIRVIGRRRATNRAGAAEYLGRSLQTVNRLASPKRRAEGSGWPDPLPGHIDGQEWYALTDLDKFRKTYVQRVEEAGRARVHHVTLDGDPDEEITAVEFRTAIDVTPNGWTKYVDMSKAAWERGEDGYLPRPDREEPVVKGRGVTRYWKRRRAQEWINNRSGSTPSPGRPVGTGRKQPNS